MCYRPGPVLKRRMYACMHEYSHFILVGCFVDAMQLPCGPGAYTLAEKETRKRTIFFYIKNTASSSNIICSSTWHFFLRTSRQKKTQHRGKKLEKLLPLYLVYVSQQGRFGKPRTNWRRGWLQRAATTRDRRVVHTCASSVLSQRATSPPPDNAKTAAISQPGPDGTMKKQISYFGDAQTGEVC